MPFPFSLASADGLSFGSSFLTVGLDSTGPPMLENLGFEIENHHLKVRGADKPL